MDDIKPIIESLLFAAEEPLTLDKLNSVLEAFDKKEIRTALETLREEYEDREGGFYLSEVAGGWQFRSRPEYHEWIKRLLQPSPQRLGRAALETLAIVAYKQPVIRADIEYIRGVDSGGVLRQLMERKLIRVLGRKEIPGRPLIYATTKLFLELFDLKDLKDLPTPKEIEELSSRGPIGEKTERPIEAQDDSLPLDSNGSAHTTQAVPGSEEETTENQAGIDADPSDWSADGSDNEPTTGMTDAPVEIISDEPIDPAAFPDNEPPDQWPDATIQQEKEDPASTPKNS
jgi:segregation and condensation protein B